MCLGSDSYCKIWDNLGNLDINQISDDLETVVLGMRLLQVIYFKSQYILETNPNFLQVKSCLDMLWNNLVDEL